MRVKFIEGYGRRLTFECLPPLSPLQLDKEKIYNLDIKEYRERRSLNANAYLWVLCSKIAEKVRSSKDEVYEDALQRYGVIESDISITVKADVDMSRIDGHWKYIQTSQDGKWKAYLKIKGTSDYDTKEMAHFLDMIIEDAKELDIETLTPDELERIKAEWDHHRETKGQQARENLQKF